MATVLRLTQQCPLLQSLLWVGLPPFPSLGHCQGTSVPLWHHCHCQSLLLIHPVLLLQDSSTLACKGSLADCWDHENTTANTTLTSSEPHPTTHIRPGTNHPPMKCPFLAAPHLSPHHIESRQFQGAAHQRLKAYLPPKATSI